MTHVTKVVAREKTRSYIECASKDDFILHAIETYCCFHSHFNLFFIFCAQVTIVRQ
jgi:hypothetical protein